MVLGMGSGMAQVADIKPVEKDIYDRKMIETALEKSTLGQFQ